MLDTDIQRRNKNLKHSESFYDVEVMPTTLDASISNEVKKLEISKANRHKLLYDLFQAYYDTRHIHHMHKM